MEHNIPLNRGVMQGSSISPLLFNLYIDDLIEGLNKITPCFGYADDIIIIARNKEIMN